MTRALLDKLETHVSQQLTVTFPGTCRCEVLMQVGKLTQNA